MTHTHAWGPPRHYLRDDGTLADFHARICSACYHLELSAPCDCTAEQRRRALGRQRVLGVPPRGWGAAEGINEGDDE